MNSNPASATVRTTFQESTRVQWSSDSAGDSFPVHSPATGEVIAVVQGGGEGEVDTAVDVIQRWRTPS
jgi:acyl-CoA reductase-like NAD-dependent aldehyde dehydrogenase